MLNSLGQCLSVAAAFSFPSHEGPRYVKGALLNLSFQSLGFCIALGMTLYFRWENRRRDRVEGGRPEKGAILDTLTDYDRAVGESTGARANAEMVADPLSCRFPLRCLSWYGFG